MADQKNDDTKTPFTRRGARPFGGTPGVAAPSRPFPFMRPATAQRPTAAPFVAPVVSGKLVLRNAAPTPTAKTPTPVAPPSIPSTDIDSTLRSTRPATNEIVARDALDAVWDESEPASHPVEPGPVAAAGLDEVALGSGADGQQPWAEDITANAIPAAESDAAASVSLEASGNAPAWLGDDAGPAALATPGPVEPEITASADDVPSRPTGVQPVLDAGGGYGFGEWTDSHTIPAFDEIMGGLPEQPVPPVIESLGDAPPGPADLAGDAAPELREPSPRLELVEASQDPHADGNREGPGPAIVAAMPTVESYSPHEARIAATFDRLADRVRSGEIDVTSIAPEATDAAVLASVLAALLGGSRSR